MKCALILLFLTIISREVQAPSIPIKTQEEIALHKEYYIKLENKIELILQTIRWIESRGNYHIVGKSKEYGAYQFSPTTWKRHCHVFFGKELNIKDPANQDAVARMKVEKLLAKGYDIEQIASIWNSGRIDYEGRIGINKYGVKYNVPKYVNTFMNKYTNTP